MLHNISRIKDDYIIKFGQLIEYNIEHLKNRTQNVMKKLVPDSFIKNQPSVNLWINSLKC